MAMIKCPECGKEVDESANVCQECGCPLNGSSSVKIEKVERERKQVKRNKGSVLGFVCAIIFFICAAFFFEKGYDVKINYYNSEDYPILNENAYVGGDAYNYIINGTYFTGYMVVGSSCMICGVLCCVGTALLSNKTKEM